MSMTCRRNASRINMACAARPVLIMIGLALLAAPVATFADMTQLHNVCKVAPDSPQCKKRPQPEPNPNCTLVVPKDPLSAEGLATPYQLKATDSSKGECNETDPNQSAFVEAAILNPKTGRLSIYRPLVIDQGDSPAVPPVVPDLPDNAVVGLWFGFNGMNLALEAAVKGGLEGCVQGLGQFAYCNAPTFFAAAHDARLRVPRLGTWGNKQPCPSARSWDLVDQDQSDNLLTTYLIIDGKLAQDTAINRNDHPGFDLLTNPSDERLLAVFVDPALGCTPWTAPDLTNPGHKVPALALNELQAGAFQLSPALIPLGDPFAQDPPYSGNPSLVQVNRYRGGVDQPMAEKLDDASTTTYCHNLVEIGGPLLFQKEKPLLSIADSPDVVADNLFLFMATRFSGTYTLLNCADLLRQRNPVELTVDKKGVVIDAEFKPM